jgi:hypothetical protein
MLPEELLEELKAKISEHVPKDVEITDLDFEGPVLVVYVKNPQKLADNGDIVKRLAKELRKRIVIRPDIVSLKPQEEAKKFIYKIVPDDAEITSVFFDPENGEVIIEAEKPGVVIGKQGQTLRDLMKHIGWTPKVVRTPPIESKTVKNIRQFLLTVKDERKEILRQIGRKIHRGKIHGGKWVRVTFLGGCREVGRSAYLLSTPESRILVDCGVNVSLEDGTPYLHLPEVQPLDSLDAVIITHAHLDHCGLVPLLYKYGYNGPIYLTPPTRDLMTLLQLDYIDVAGREGGKIPYDSSMVREALKHTITLDYGVVTDIAPDIRLTFHNAGHILGSAIVHLHIGDGLYNVAFSGDFKYEKTRLFNKANTAFPRLESLIMEATYGGSEDFQPTRKDAETHLCDLIKKTIERKGKVLIPTFAVGRSQEVMIVLEEAIREKRIDEVPVYLDGMIYEATAIHTTYPEYLNNDLRNMIFHQGLNPFKSESFVRVDSSSKRDEVMNDSGPAVVLATSGMLNGGPVMEYFRAFASDEKNMLVFVGYQAEGTMGRRIQKGWKEIPISSNGRTETIELKMDVETVDGFSGHSDRRQLIEFIRRLSTRPERVITVHGDENKCIDLASSIYKQFRFETRAPMNLETIRLV